MSIQNALIGDAADLYSERKPLILSRDAPVVFKRGCVGWPAFSKWDFDFFIDHYGERTIPISRYNTKGPEAESDRLKKSIYEFLTTLKKIRPSQKTGTKIDDSYIAGWHYTKDLPELNDDIVIPNIFSDNILPKVNDEIIKYDWRSLFIGSSVSHTPVHTDSFYVAVWLAVIVGRKTIRYVPSSYHNQMGDRPNLFSEDDLKNLNKNNVPVFEALVEPGDIAYHPPGW